MNSFEFSQALHDWFLSPIPDYRWGCHVAPGVVWHVEEGQQPNWFWRKMQFLCFGFRWERLRKATGARQ